MEDELGKYLEKDKMRYRGMTSVYQESALSSTHGEEGGNLLLSPPRVAGKGTIYMCWQLKHNAGRGLSSNF